MAADAPIPPSPSVTSRLWWFAAWLLCLVVMFAVSYPLVHHHERLVDIGILSEYRVLALVVYGGGIGAMFVLYLLALRTAMAATSESPLLPVVAGGVLFSVVMAALYPVNAIDLFIYAVRSRIFTTHGENPLVWTPADFPDDPLMAFASVEWSVTGSPYGPLWNLIAAPVTALAGDNLLAALIGFKLLAVLAVLAGAWLIAHTRRAAGMPVAAGVLLYLWNPLVLWEGIGNGHNDTVMMVPIVAAMLAWTTGRDRLVIPLLVVAVFLKYVAVLALPLAIVALWRRQPSGRQRAGWIVTSALLSLLVAGIALAPFYDPRATWSSLTAQGGIFLTSPAAVALSYLRDSLGGASATTLVTTVGTSLMAVFLLVQLALLWYRPDRFPRALFETMFVFLLIAAWNFRVWYLIWLVAPAALLPIGWPAWRTIAWTAGGLAGYVLFIWVWHWWDADFPTVQAIGVLILTGPAIVVTIIELVQLRRSRRGVVKMPIEARTLREGTR
ncbi:MAG: hypothetical protein M3509_13280 [Chloroflexota bacterium]|nr:hypothetical protein [Chloroflexota bacterium]